MANRVKQRRQRRAPSVPPPSTLRPAKRKGPQRSEASRVPMTGPEELSGAELRMMARTPLTWALSCIRIAYLPYDAWCAYLTGLIEGDGHFSKNGLEIEFDIRDIALAHALRKRLRLPQSTVQYRPGKRKNGSSGKGSYRLKVNLGGRAFQHVLRAVNGRFVGPFKIAQILEHRLNTVNTRVPNPNGKPGAFYVRNQKLTMLPNDPKNARGWWITGFGDADMSAFLTWHPRCNVRIAFSQTDPYLLRAMHHHLELPWSSGVREQQCPHTGKITKVKEHQLVTNGIDDLRRVLRHYARYPAQGIKGGHLFLIRQAYLIQVRFYNRTHRRVSLYRRIRFARLWAIREALTLSHANGRWVYHAESTDPRVHRARGSQDTRRRSAVRGQIFNLSRDLHLFPLIARNPQRSWGPWVGGDGNRPNGAERVFWIALADATSSGRDDDDV